LTSSRALKGRGFLLQDGDVRRENVPRGVDVAVVDRFAIVASPYSYSKTCDAGLAPRVHDILGLNAEVFGRYGDKVDQDSRE